MKNIIAITSLLAAGTVFASAETVITVADLGKSATQAAISYDVSGSTGTFSGSGLFSRPTGGRHAAGITFNLDLTALGITDSSSTYSGSSVQLVDYRTSANSTSSAIGLAVIANGVQFTWGDSAYSSSLYVSWSTLWDKKYDVAGNSYVTMTLVGANMAGGTAAAGTALYDDTGVLFNANNGKGYSFGSLTSTNDYSVITLADTSVLSGASIFSGSPTVAEIAAASQAILVIPEPSAFGLLAGVGALAFVAARRRRRAK